MNTFEKFNQASPSFRDCMLPVTRWDVYEHYPREVLLDEDRLQEEINSLRTVEENCSDWWRARRINDVIRHLEAIRLNLMVDGDRYDLEQEINRAGV